MAEKDQVLLSEANDNKQDQLVSKLEDQLNKARSELADGQKQLDKLTDKAQNYIERFTKKLEKDESVLATLTQNIEQHRQKLFEAMGQVNEASYDCEDSIAIIDQQMDESLKIHSRELGEMQNRKLRIYEKFSEAREHLEKKISKNGEMMQDLMEFIQTMKKRIRELKDQLKEASKDK